MRVAAVVAAVAVGLGLGLAAVGAGGVSDKPAAPPTAVPGTAVDALGDPLPPGAVRRFGSPRLRHFGGVDSVAFAPDGKTLASAGEDRMVSLWDAAAGRELRRCAGHQGRVYSVAFAPDGRTLASVGADGVLLWEVARWELRLHLAHDPTRRACWSGGGRLLTSVEGNGTAMLWRPGGPAPAAAGPPSGAALDRLWAALAGDDAAVDHRGEDEFRPEIDSWPCPAPPCGALWGAIERPGPTWPWPRLPSWSGTARRR